MQEVWCTNRAVTAKGTISSRFEGPLIRSLVGFAFKYLWQTCGPARQCSTVLTCGPARQCSTVLTCGPARQCTTILTCTLMVDCPWCLPRTAPRWFYCAYCWWVWALLMQFLPNFVSSVTSTDDTNKILMFADKTTIKNCPMVGDQQAIDPPHLVHGKGTSATHRVPPPKRSRDQQWRLTPCVRCW
jgi:hypothetical protein